MTLHTVKGKESGHWGPAARDSLKPSRRRYLTVALMIPPATPTPPRPDHFDVRRAYWRASVTSTNVASLRRNVFSQKGLVTLSQQCYQPTQDSPVYRVDDLSFHGHRPA